MLKKRWTVKSKQLAADPDVDASVAKALAAGATLAMEVMDMPYDDRQDGVVDPFGNIWWSSQRLIDGPYF